MSETLNRTGYFFGQNKRQLFYQSWTVKNPKGIIFITHGLSENTDRYDYVARSFNKDQWNVYAWDLRGHGRSTGVRGYVRRFRLFERDLVHFSHFVLKKEKSIPYVYVGHSLGGLILSRALFHEETIISLASGVCLIAPSLGLRINVSLLKMILFYLTSYICPGWTYYENILTYRLTRDPHFQQRIEHDAFRHDKISPEIYINVLKNIKVVKRVNKMYPRLLIQLGGKDIVVDNVVNKQYFDSVQTDNPKKLIVYPLSMHQLFEDFDRKTVIQDLKNFILPIIS